MSRLGRACVTVGLSAAMGAATYGSMELITDDPQEISEYIQSCAETLPSEPMTISSDNYKLADVCLRFASLRSESAAIPMEMHFHADQDGHMEYIYHLPDDISFRRQQLQKMSPKTREEREQRCRHFAVAATVGSLIFFPIGRRVVEKGW